MEGRNERESGPRAKRTFLVSFIQLASLSPPQQRSWIRWTPRSKGILSVDRRMQRGMLLAHPARALLPVLFSEVCGSENHTPGDQLLESQSLYEEGDARRERLVTSLSSFICGFETLGLLGGSLFRLDQLKTYLHSSCQRSRDFWCQHNMGLAVNATWCSHWEKRKTKSAGSGSLFQAVMERTVNAAGWEAGSLLAPCSQHSCSQYGLVSFQMGARLRLYFPE